MHQTDTQPAAKSTARRKWEPLGYEKIAAADAELTFNPTGTDASVYS